MKLGTASSAGRLLPSHFAFNGSLSVGLRRDVCVRALGSGRFRLKENRIHACNLWRCGSHYLRMAQWMSERPPKPFLRRTLCRLVAALEEPLPSFRVVYHYPEMQRHEKCQPEAMQRRDPRQHLVVIQLVPQAPGRS